MTKRRTGWGPAANSRKWHYYGQDGMSLCRKYAWLGPSDSLDDSNHESSDNCAACRRKKLKQLEREGDE